MRLVQTSLSVQLGFFSIHQEKRDFSFHYFTPRSLLYQCDPKPYHPCWYQSIPAMSASAPRGPRGGSASRGARAGANLSRGSARGSSTRGRGGSGRGRGASSTNTASGLLQQLRSGTIQRGEGTGHSISRARAPASTGTVRGRGHLSQSFNTNDNAPRKTLSRSSSPAPTSVRDFMNHATARFQLVSNPPIPAG
jgi:hypothetical protein